VLTDGARLTIAAVFERSFYVTDGCDFACIGVAGIGRGPLNACLAAGAAWNGPGADEGTSVAIDSRRIVVRGLPRFSLIEAKIWSPFPITAQASSLAIERLRMFLTEASARAPEMGVSRAVFADDHTSTPVLRAASGPIAVILGEMPNATGRESSSTVPASIAEAAIELLGLGPGLTPSGDDFIGGLLLALRTIGHGALADAIWKRIAPALSTRTSALSAAHLRAAAAGAGAEAVHAPLAAILEGDDGDVASHLAALDRVGHCSGWDAMAGVVVALCAGLSLREIITAT
jgi:hypothetical protein